MAGTVEEQAADLDKVSKWWAQTPDVREQLKLVAWMDSEHVKRHINRRITGDESLDWFSYVLQKYFPAPARRALSLGCGGGGLERHGLSAGAIDAFDAFDVSEGAIESAKSAAQEAGLFERVNYAVADLNLLDVPAAAYDVVFASMSVHHIESLEHVFGEVRKSLKPGGLFIVNEYVGPTKFQLPPAQLKLINELLGIIPPRYRRMIKEGRATDEIKQAHHLQTLEWFDEHDPSEAVRSADILPVLKEFFEIVEFKPYGGTLLHFLLENIVGNFDDGQEDGQAWLDMLAYFETTLERGGMIESDFALIVARPKPEREASLMNQNASAGLGAGPPSTTQMFELHEMLARKPSQMSTNIASGDEMFQGNPEHYFGVGQSALQCVRVALLAAGKPVVRRVLDLPCGHGRVLRALKAAFPEAEFSACDLLRDGVDFCAREFAATPVYAEVLPENIRIAGQFDLIWCGSLLTHLDAERWTGFVKLFQNLLAPEGVLVFTTHGRYVADRVRRGETDYGLEPHKVEELLSGYDRRGFGFGNYFHSEDYGISVSTPSWVCSQLEVLPGMRLLTFTERGWDKHQDVVACMRVA